MALITSANPRLFDFVVQFEHPVPWMYLDSRGLPTVGIGHLIGKARNASRSEAKEDALFIHHRFGFHAGGRRATDTEVITRLYSLLATPEAGHRNNLHHTHWQTRPSATPPVEMDQAGIRALKQYDLGLRITGLSRPGSWPGGVTASLPEPVQIVLVDIAFNAGVGSFRRPNMAPFRAAVDARDFAGAADVVARGDFPISRAARNWKRAELLRRA